MPYNKNIIIAQGAGQAPQSIILTDPFQNQKLIGKKIRSERLQGALFTSDIGGFDDSDLNNNNNLDGRYYNDRFLTAEK